MEKDSDIIMILVLILIFPTISYADLPDDFCNDLRQLYSNEISDHIQCHDTGKIRENKFYLLFFITNIENTWSNNICNSFDALM